jgi:raffinose/stachyose/melibiose transport system permease protein
MRFRGADLLFYLLLVGLIFPYEATVIPLYYVFKDYGLTDSLWALILPQIGLSVPFGTFWMRAFFRSTPGALVEASRLDGASSLVTLWRVLLPQAWPAITTMLVLVFMWTWNEFLLALVMIQSDELRTAPLGLALFAGANRGSQDVTLTAAAAVIVALPVVIVYVFLQRSFIRGMFAGAVKE